MLKTGILSLATLIMALAAASLAQTNAPSGTSASPLNIPSDMGIVAKLQTDVDASKLQVGDKVQAQTIRDLKRGHDVLLKKGSTLIGKVTKVEAYAPGTPSSVAIVFDQVTPAGGQLATLNVTIQALAPAPGVQTDSLQDGRGMAQTNINSAVGGNKDLGNGGELLSTSVGVYGMNGVSLASAASGGKQYSFIKSANGNVNIKAGSQVVFKAAEQ